MFKHLLFSASIVCSGGALADTVPAQGIPADLVAEDQTPTGKFTTAAEIKQILDLTKANWIAVREWNGEDLIYVSHLWAWRCGLVQIELGVNGAPLEVWRLPDCHSETAQPNAIIESDGVPYRNFSLKSVENVEVRVILDDLSVQSASFTRKEILLP